jgi:hypothetical protein
VGGFLAWLVNTLCSAVVGIIWGLVIMAILNPLLKVLPFGKKDGGHEPGDHRAAAAGHAPAGHTPTKHDGDSAR